MEQAPEWPFEEESAAEAAYLRFQRSLHPIEHLLGYPQHTSLAYDPTPPGAIAFLTLCSLVEFDWTWHDGDYLQVFVRPDELAAGDFSDLRSDAG